MHLNIPSDIRAEALNAFLSGSRKDFLFLGRHKRNAYHDILSITEEEETIKIELSKPGMYDILPEALFHPIDRFDNIPANEYKERFAEEVEQQRREEADARSFFSLYDNFLFGLSSIVGDLKQSGYGDNHVLSDIICDSMPDKYSSNRFVGRAKGFLPRSSSIRGNMTLITLMLRKIMADEGLKLTVDGVPTSFKDASPRYSCRLLQEDLSEEYYLGSAYDENVVTYGICYWNDDYCNEDFLLFVKDVKVFEEFLNDYFMGVETFLRFDIQKHSQPVRLSDDMCNNYLNYNTNL